MNLLEKLLSDFMTVILKLAGLDIMIAVQSISFIFFTKNITAYY